MIDTDKYEGHTEGLWFDGEPTKISNAISNAFFQLNPNEIGKANTRLAVDAPLLLAEVKRLNEWIEQAIDVWENCNHEDRTDWFDNFCRIHKEEGDDE
jgi:hypothetical protein